MRVNLLPYVARLAKRSCEDIDLVVIHCTELPDLAAARTCGERIKHAGSRTGDSGHYYIDRNGDIHNWVGIDRVAHHVRNYNQRSIGIELVNRGRWPDWFNSDKQLMTEAYSDEQLDALLSLLNRLQSELTRLRWIAGHEQLDRGRVTASDSPDRTVYRKGDPGPEFPWDSLLCSIQLSLLPLQESK